MFTCKDIIRDKHGRIISYKLLDKYGHERYLTPAQIKQLLVKDLIQIDNLKLTRDYRLIKSDTVEEALNLSGKDKKIHTALGEILRSVKSYDMSDWAHTKNDDERFKMQLIDRLTALSEFVERS